MTIDDGYAWDHGDYAAEINTNYIGFVGPGVKHLGLDGSGAERRPELGRPEQRPEVVANSGTTGTWTDETDIRPDAMYLTGLKDDYEHDGRVITQILADPNRALQRSRRDQPGGLLQAAQLQRRPVRQLHPAGRHRGDREQLAGRRRVPDHRQGAGRAGPVRDALALRIKGELEAAAFGDQPIFGAPGQTVACQAIIASAGVLAQAPLSQRGRAAVRRQRQGGGAAIAPRAGQWAGGIPSRGRPAQGPRDVVILGSTGSIGTQALDIVRRNPGRFRVVALAAGGGHPDLLASQAAEFGVAAVAVASPAAAAGVQDALRALFGRTDRGSPCAAPGALPGRTRSARWPRGRATWCSTA